MNPMRCMGFNLKMAALRDFYLFREARNPVKPGGVRSESWTMFRSGKFLVILLDKKFYFEFNEKSIIIQIL